MILGCVAAFVGFIVLAFGVLLWKKRRLQAARGARLVDPVYDVPSEQLVPWLTRGSPTQTRLVQQFPMSTTSAATRPLLAPAGTEEGTARSQSELAPSPGYSRVPAQGHHSAPNSDGIPTVRSASGSSSTLGLDGSSRSLLAKSEEVPSDSPPPYPASEVGSGGVGSDLVPPPRR
ncbi:hypothetical protein JCM3766R1_006085 [Sporobolomyces carnicolor]